VADPGGQFGATSPQNGCGVPLKWRPSDKIHPFLMPEVETEATGAQPVILFGRVQSLTSSDFTLQFFCTKIILMSLVDFWSITTGCDVKYLLTVGIGKF